MLHGFISRNDVIKSFRDLPPATLRPLQSAVDRISSIQSNNVNELKNSGNQSPTKKESKDREREIERDTGPKSKLNSNK